MYVDQSQACSVQNSAMPAPPSEVAAKRAAYQSMMQRMDAAQHVLDEAVYCRQPSQFSDMGGQVAGDVAISPPGGAGGSASTVAAVSAPATAASSTAAPGSSGVGLWVSLPAGGSKGAAGESGGPCGCDVAGPVFHPIGQGAPIPLPPAASLVPSQGVSAVVRKAVPAVPAVPTTGAPVYPAPTWSNICWAMRFGLVDRSQFDPAQFQAANIRCSELGYTGGCAPPYAAQMYLQQGLAKGTLPHIDLSDDLIAALPPAPAVVGCDAASQKAAGLSGLGARTRRRRGGFGDYVCSASAPTVPSAAGGALSWVAANPLWTFAGISLLLVLAGDGKGGRA
jgi:hypothetical protein